MVRLEFCVFDRGRSLSRQSRRLPAPAFPPPPTPSPQGRGGRFARIACALRARCVDNHYGDTTDMVSSWVESLGLNDNATLNSIGQGGPNRPIRGLWLVSLSTFVYLAPSAINRGAKLLNYEASHYTEHKKTRFFLPLCSGGPRAYKQNYLILGVWITFIKREKPF